MQLNQWEGRPEPIPSPPKDPKNGAKTPETSDERAETGLEAAKEGRRAPSL
jgi:hypothetical protein